MLKNLVISIKIYIFYSNNLQILFRIMLILILATLIGSAFSAELDPKLTEWTNITRGIQKFYFPIKDYILEVKSMLPDEYDDNPNYGVEITTDKSTTMMVHLYNGSWKNRVGLLVWNTIKYDKGYDVAIDECNARYQAYKSFPALGKKEQHWEWTFNNNNVTLTCDGELQYSQHFDNADRSWMKPHLPVACRFLGDTDVDRISFWHMEGLHFRGRKMDKQDPSPPTPAATNPPIRNRF